MENPRTRVARLEREMRPAGQRLRTVTANVWRRPEGTRAVLAAACEAGDREAQEELVEGHEGKRPRLGGARVALILAWPPEPAEGSDRT